MTLYEDENDMDTNTQASELNGKYRNTRVYSRYEKNDLAVGLTENGNFISMETSGHSVNELFRLDSTSLVPLSTDTYFGGARNEVDSLCKQLGSVEMTDLQQTTPSFDEIMDSDRKSNNIAANFDSERIYTRDKDGDTLLHTAIILREISLIMQFITKAPSHTWLSFKNLLFQTPLHLAVLTDQPEVTRRLIVAGAEVDARDKDGNTALHIACREGQQKNLHYLLEPVRYHETKKNSYEIPYQKIPQDFSLTNYEGLTCLHVAAMNGHLDIVEALLDKDINVNLKEGKTGRTILHNACLNGDSNLVKLLLRHRECNINARAFDDSTPFDLARARGHDHVCMLLAAAGARYGEECSDSD